MMAVVSTPRGGLTHNVFKDLGDAGMLEVGEINTISVLVGAGLGYVLGGLWYSPILFGKAWMAAIGKTPEDLGSPVAGMIGSAITSIIAAGVVALLVNGLGLSTWTDGVCLSLLIGVGLVGTSMLSDNFFSGTSWNLFFIQSGYRVCYFIVMAGAVAALSNPKLPIL